MENQKLNKLNIDAEGIIQQLINQNNNIGTNEFDIMPYERGIRIQTELKKHGITQKSIMLTNYAGLIELPERLKQFEKLMKKDKDERKQIREIADINQKVNELVTQCKKVIEELEKKINEIGTQNFKETNCYSDGIKTKHKIKLLKKRIANVKLSGSKNTLMNVVDKNLTFAKLYGLLAAYQQKLTYVEQLKTHLHDRAKSITNEMEKELKGLPTDFGRKDAYPNALKLKDELEKGGYKIKEDGIFKQMCETMKSYEKKIKFTDKKSFTECLKKLQEFKNKLNKDKDIGKLLMQTKENETDWKQIDQKLKLLAADTLLTMWPQYANEQHSKDAQGGFLKWINDLEKWVEKIKTNPETGAPTNQNIIGYGPIQLWNNIASYTNDIIQLIKLIYVFNQE